MASLQAVYECPDGTPFPVEWPSAEMAEYGWSWDQMHHTTPLTPLAQGLLHFKADGMTRGSDSTGTVMRNERVIANGYVFGHALPVEPDELAVLAAVAEHDIARRLGRLLELWDTRYRPEVEALPRSLRTWATPEDSLAELAHRFDEVCAIAGRLGELHSIAFGMTNVAMGRFQAFCRAEFGDDGDAMALEAVAGMPNKSLESAEALWQLSPAGPRTPGGRRAAAGEPAGRVPREDRRGGGWTRIPDAARRLPRHLRTAQRIVQRARLPHVARGSALRDLHAQELPRRPRGAEPRRDAREDGEPSRGSHEGGAGAPERPGAVRGVPRGSADRTAENDPAGGP